MQVVNMKARDPATGAEAIVAISITEDEPGLYSYRAHFTDRPQAIVASGRNLRCAYHEALAIATKAVVDATSI